MIIRFGFSVGVMAILLLGGIWGCTSARISSDSTPTPTAGAPAYTMPSPTPAPQYAASHGIGRTASAGGYTLQIVTGAVGDACGAQRPWAQGYRFLFLNVSHIAAPHAEPVLIPNHAVSLRDAVDNMYRPQTRIDPALCFGDPLLLETILAPGALEPGVYVFEIPPGVLEAAPHLQWTPREGVVLDAFFDRRELLTLP